MKKSIFDRNFFIVLALDTVLCTLALYGAYLVRFDFDIPEYLIGPLLNALPVVLAIKIGCFYFFDLYRGMWRYTGVADMLNIFKAVSLSSLLTIGWILLYYRFTGYPRSAFAIDWCFTLMAVSGSRMAIRLFFQKNSPARSTATESLQVVGGERLRALPTKAKRLLIVGAGNCGEKIFREIHDNPQLAYKVVGFLDDDPFKIGRTLHGIPVVGIIGDLKSVARHLKAEEALIAVPSANAQEMRRIVSICKESGLPFKTVPGYGELIDGKVTVKAIRDVAYRDLLGRPTVKIDEREIEGYLRGHRVLITGAGGSIGSELCRQIARFHPGEIVLFERAESPLYDIELELRQLPSAVNLVPVLGDILDREHLRRIFRDHRPQTIFHAAAYKHVPMLEEHPWKAIENNIVGTSALVQAADEFGAERFVLVSTDKAVRPANVMGASKRVAEMITLNTNSCSLSRTRFMAVRFGNVVGSVGSVVPLFKKQIETGGPVTVTHPEVTRFFMTIREACRLILQAGAMGQGGEIFVLDMGTPVKITDMARDLIRLSGFEPDVDIRIEYIGLRPGEKLFEELVSDGEDILPTAHAKISRLKGEACDLSLLNGFVEDLAALAAAQDSVRIRSKLNEILPEFKPAPQAAPRPRSMEDPPSPRRPSAVSEA
jgi:FlaA1/EpsC-like NDP-sugar epimerase